MTPAGGAGAADDADGPRRRILEATLDCVGRQGLGKTSLEDVAHAAGLSRATVYRYFPGGRDEVITETVAFEIDRFLLRVVAAVADARGITEKLTSALVEGHRAIDEHLLLQQILSTEPEALLVELAETGPQLHAVICGEIERYLLDEQLRDGVVVPEAAEYLARLYLSYIGSQGAFDLSDRTATEQLVRTQFLAGILAPSPAPIPAPAPIPPESRS